MPTPICPTPETLLGFARGELPDDEIETVSDHLEACAGCEDTVAQFEGQPDTFIGRLQAPVVKSRFAGEPEFQDAVDAARAVANQPERADLPPSETQQSSSGQMGDYQLLTRLGHGGMGTVYRALHTRLRRIVALKVLAGHRRHDPAVVERFAREIEAAGKLSHPNIVTAHDAGEEDGVHYLVMELVNGVDLQTLVSQHGPLPVADACEIIRQAALGLQHAHEHGLVHRDLKPSNIMLAYSASGGREPPGISSATSDSSNQPAHAGRSPVAQVKILDLGLALRQGEQTAAGNLTGTGQVMGTLDYMAPEQADDSHGVDIRADIYALGCSLYTLLTGRAPFAGAAYNTPARKIVAHAQSVPEPIQARRNDVPDDLAGLLTSMLAKSPNQRPSVPADVAAALQPFVAGHDLGTLAAETAGTSHQDLPVASADEIPGMIGPGGGYGMLLPGKPQPAGHRRGGFWLWTGLALIGVAIVCLANTLSIMMGAYANPALSRAGLAFVFGESLRPMLLGGPAFLLGLIFVIVGVVSRWQGGAVIEKQPSASRPHPPWWFAVTTGLTVLLLAIFAVVTVYTPQGELKIETVDPDVQVEVRTADDTRVAIVDTKTDTTIKLMPGQYGLRVVGEGAEYEIDRDRLTILRGQRVLVRVTRKAPASQQAEEAPAEDRSSQPLFAGKPLSYWTAQLKDRDAEYREKAVDALVSFGAAGADPLIALLPAGDKPSRLQALAGLRRLAPDAEHAVPAVIEAMGDKDEQIRERAALCLAEFGSAAAAAVPALAELTTDTNVDLRELAVWALWRIRSRPDETVPTLIQATTDADPRVVRAAAFALGSWPGHSEQVVPALAAVFHLPERKQRLDLRPDHPLVAAEFLSDQQRNDLFGEDNSGVQLINATAAASYALGQLGPPGAEKLIELSRGNDRVVTIKYGLAFCPDPAAVRRLSELLQKKEVTWHAMNALGTVAERNETAFLAAMRDLSHADRAEVGWAVGCYDCSGGPCYPPGLEAPDWRPDYPRDHAAEYVFEQLSPEGTRKLTALAALTAALIDPDRARQFLPGVLPRKEAAPFRESIENVLRFLDKELPDHDDNQEGTGTTNGLP